MSRPGSVDRLPQPIREEIGRLRMAGVTLDQVLAHLRTLLPEDSTPSRSALGRYALKMDALGEKMRRSRAMAEGLAAALGEKPGSQAATLNIELLHSTVMDLFAADADAGDDVDKQGQAALAGNPEGVMMLSKAVESLTRAAKTNNDYVVAAERRATDLATKAAAAKVDVVAKRRGIAADTVDAIKREIFGVAA
jgi:hypothetical protein